MKSREGPSSSSWITVSAIIDLYSSTVVFSFAFCSTNSSFGFSCVVAAAPLSFKWFPLLATAVGAASSPLVDTTELAAFGLELLFCRDWWLVWDCCWFNCSMCLDKFASQASSSVLDGTFGNRRSNTCFVRAIRSLLVSAALRFDGDVDTWLALFDAWKLWNEQNKLDKF